MIQETEIAQMSGPSMKKIAVATAIAFVVAVVILVVAVLPAEYGIDPLGTGKALGLTELAKASGSSAAAALQAPAATSSPTDAVTQQVLINPVLVPSPTGDAPTMKDTFIAQGRSYKFDSREITLRPGEGMEIKYHMDKGAGLIYSWTADPPVFYEFHGDPDVKPAGKERSDYYESYDLSDKIAKDQSNGTFIAPSRGLHGWFWENKGPNAVTLKLTTAGFYDWIFQNRNDKEIALKTMDPLSLPSHPKVPDEDAH